MTELTAIETLALAKAVDSKSLKEAREALGAGTHVFDVTVRIRGSHAIGEDYETVVAASVPFRDLFLHLASKAPQVMVESAVREVLSGEAPKAKKPKVLDLIDSLLEKTKKVAKGKVTGRGLVEKVQAKAKAPKRAKDAA